MSKKTETKAVSRHGDMSRAQWTLHLMKQNWIAYVMIAPFMILFFALTVLPIVVGLIVSLTNYNMLQWPDFVGFDNYVQLFLNDELFLKALSNTLVFAVAVGPASYILSFVVAWFINEIPPKARAVVTLIFYAPSISGGAYVVFKTLFSSDAYGWVNAWLIKLGIIDTPILFFSDVSYIMPLCIVVALWMSLGTAFLSFIAGLQGLDRSQFEAAAVDGITNRWQELWYVTLPNMKPQLMFGAVLAITQSFGFGTEVTELTNSSTGGTDYTAYTLTHHIGEYGNSRWEVGYASAINFVLFLLMIGSNMLINKMLAKVGQ